MKKVIGLIISLFSIFTVCSAVEPLVVDGTISYNDGRIVRDYTIVRRTSWCPCGAINSLVYEMGYDYIGIDPYFSIGDWALNVDNITIVSPIGYNILFHYSTVSGDFNSYSRRCLKCYKYLTITTPVNTVSTGKSTTATYPPGPWTARDVTLKNVTSTQTLKASGSTSVTIDGGTYKGSPAPVQRRYLL